MVISLFLFCAGSRRVTGRGHRAPDHDMIPGTDFHLGPVLVELPNPDPVVPFVLPDPGAGLILLGQRPVVPGNAVQAVLKLVQILFGCPGGPVQRVLNIGGRVDNPVLTKNRVDILRLGNAPSPSFRKE